jgi:hypothetical protein
MGLARAGIRTAAEDSGSPANFPVFCPALRLTFEAKEIAVKLRPVDVFSRQPALSTCSTDQRDHVSADDPPNRLVTFPRGVLQRFVFGPFNFNYHAEHHRHANVPPCNLRRLHFFLADAGNLDGVIVSAGYLSRLRQVTAALHRSPR